MQKLQTIESRKSLVSFRNVLLSAASQLLQRLRKNKYKVHFLMHFIFIFLFVDVLYNVDYHPFAVLIKNKFSG